MNDETEKRGPGRPPKQEKFPCEVLRDYWTAEGDRIRKGTIVDLPAGEALDGVEAGRVRRVK